MTDENFWTIIKDFNFLMKSSVIGPNCIDPNLCKGDCCSIKIDVPKVLAKEYIKRGYALKDDFIRGDVFSFQLRFDNIKRKCFLFDMAINGCRVHNSGIKPPQCWIYPTNFSNPEDKEISCKKATGWQIINSENALKAEQLLKKYNFLCQLEAKKELKKIKKRMGADFSSKSVQKVKDLFVRIQQTAPSKLGGFEDKWNSIAILSAEGFSLQMKKFCQKYNKNCDFLPNDFLNCKSICDVVANNLILFLQRTLYEFIQEHGPDSDGQYSLIRLFEFSNTI